MNCIITHLVVGALLLGILSAQIPKSGYVVNSTGENLSMINLENQIVTGNAEPLGKWTNHIVIRGEKAYVVNSAVNEIQVIDLSSVSTVKNIDVGTGTNPYAIDFVNDSIAVVSLLVANQISFINVNAEQVIQTVHVGGGPEGIKYTDGKVYVANSGFNGLGYDPGVVSVIDVSDYSVSDISVGINPQDLDIDINGNIIVACTGDYISVPGQIYIIDSHVDTVLYNIIADNAITAVAVNSMNKAYLGSFGAGVLVYDLVNQKFEIDAENPLPGGPGLTVDSQDNLYITDFIVDSVYLYSPKHEKLNAYLVGDGPVSIAVYDPNITSIDLSQNLKINGFMLYQNFPNPFNPLTYIQFEIPNRGMVKIEFFNILGEKVTSLINKEIDAGSHRIYWNAKDEQGIPVPSGAYFYQLKFGEYRMTKKMQIVR